MDSVVKTFLDLVKIDSPSGEEDKVADFIVKELESHTNVKKDKFGNVYASVDGIGEPLFFSGHMDTVEPGRGVMPTVTNGEIKASGNTILGADNKAALAPMIELAKGAKKYGAHAPIEFVFTKSEETGGYGAINFDYKLLKARKGFCFDTARPIGTIISASPFYERFDIKITGKDSHASRPELAINALTAFSSFLNEIKLGAVSDGIRANIGVVTSGSVRNTIPGSVVVKGEVRTFKEKDIEDYKKTIYSALETQKSKAGITYTADFVRENSGYDYGKGDAGWELIKYASGKLEKTGIKPNVTKSWAISDVNIFNEKGLTCINLGDGVENPHTAEETISVANLNKMHSIMVSFISP